MAPPVSRARARQVALSGAVVAVTAVILVVDVSLPLGYNVAFLYVVVVLLASILRRTDAVVITATGALLATSLAPLAKAHATGELPIGAVWFGRSVAGLVIAITAVIVVTVLVRERENAELGQALRSAEHQRERDRRMLAAASDVTPIGTWSIDAHDDRFDWSPTAALIHGLEPGVRPTRAEVLSLFEPADADRLREALRLAWKTGEPFREELRIRLADGSQRWIVKMGKTLRASGETVARLHGTIQDVTRWKSAEEDAAALTNRFAQFAAVMPIIIWTADAQGRIEYFNQTLADYAGIQEGELLGDAWVEAVDPRDLDRVKQTWSHSLATGEPYDIEYRVRSAHGTYEWHHLAAQAERDETGSIVRWWGSSINVDATRKLREEADALAAEREIILESMTDGLYALDEQWRIVYVNSSTERILGRPREELVGAQLWDLYPAAQRNEAYTRMHRVMEQGGSDRLEFYSQGLDAWLDLSFSRSSTGLTVFLRDVTELRRLSEQLAQSQRLESVGRLTGGVAHDFNNVLTVVLGGADAVLADPDVRGEAAEMARLVVEAAQRGAELTNRLLAFARRQPLQPRAVSPFDLLTHLAPLLDRTLGGEVELVIAPEPGTPAIEVDPSQLENALLNLTINARDAMPDGGRVAIEARQVVLDEGYVASHAEVEPGTYVAITVTDTGTGIAPEILDHLFDPFFTTKPSGKGSGLGLAMVWGFVKQSGGHVSVYSEPGQGAAFRMFFPLADGELAPAGKPAEAVTSVRGSGTVLLAEDDELVQQFAAKHLRSLGYHVVTASSGPEALSKLEAMETLDLLFTDVIMPGGMTGRHLADAVVAARPGTPVLYASGYTENVIVHNGRLDAGVDLLAKPYSARQLALRVHDILSSEKGEPQ